MAEGSPRMTKNGRGASLDAVEDSVVQQAKRRLVRLKNLFVSCVGTDKLKVALSALGLKSGGTPQQRAERLWLTKHMPLEKLDRKHFAKSSAAGKTPEEAQKLQNAAREVALLEAKVRSCAFPLLTGGHTAFGTLC